MEQQINWHSRFSQQARWTAELRGYVLSRISDVRNMIEIGCGTGAVLSDLSAGMSSRETCRFFGLDIDLHFLQQAAGEIPHAGFVQGDAHSLPFPNGCFDLAFTHYLLLWVQDPFRVLLECQRVVRPGGWVAAFAEPDYGGRIDYPPALAEFGRAQEQSLRSQGADTRLGRQLKALFHRAGFKKIECGVIGAQWQEQPETDELSLEWEVALADLTGHIPQADLEKYKSVFFNSGRSGEQVLFVPTFYAFGQV